MEKFKMVRLGFKKVYEKYILDETKRTTCRLGDKSDKYFDKPIDLVIGSRYKQRIIKRVLAVDIKVKKWKDVTDSDLFYESPDCRTKEGLRCVMFHINGKILEDDDVVTLITWEY